MRAIATGLGGTVAPALAAELRTRGHEIVRWDRASDPPSTEEAVRTFIDRHKPRWVCHVATGAPEWAEWIARHCAARGISLLWTGSVSVYADGTVGPPGGWTVQMPPTATDDYGKYKAACEGLVLTAHPGAIAARIGWQIGREPGSNTMTNYLSKLATEHGGTVTVSRGWVPSCAMLEDTARALADLMGRGEPGLFHLEGNTRGLSLFDIATGLNAKQGRGWRVEPTEAPIRDNRMRDDRARMGQVADALR